MQIWYGRIKFRVEVDLPFVGYVRCGVAYVTAFMAMDRTDQRASAFVIISCDAKSTNNAGMNCHVSLGPGS